MYIYFKADGGIIGFTHIKFNYNGIVLKLHYVLNCARQV
ncbi:unnamed protein product [Leptidea sinapis]|uniref:Uncharacterized protein n=1 Tax=Leptidea sinapis TaxID=189913 RepID=A0A5E4QL89_9NEOP|nr:unnamed protein product [Leptidea sinapis]